MMNALIVIGLVSIFISGIIFASYGIISISYDGFSIKRVLLWLIGVIMLVSWIYLVKKVSNSNLTFYKENHPVEIITSVPPQIDTTLIIKSGISDTTYTYIFQKQFIKSK